MGALESGSRARKCVQSVLTIGHGELFGAVGSRNFFVLEGSSSSVLPLMSRRFGLWDGSFDRALARNALSF